MDKVKTDRTYKKSGLCEICNQVVTPCIVIWEVDSFSRADDEKIGQTCKKDLRAFAQKHNLEYV